MATKAFSLHKNQLRGPRGSTVIITGGSAGIGLRTALLLHELGNNVALLDRSAPQPSTASTLISSTRVLFCECDVTSWKSQRAAFEATERKFGSIDAVFVNAGINEYQDQFFKDEMDEDGLLQEPDRRTIDVDLRAANDTVKLAIHYMRKKGSLHQKGGSIVITASLAGYLASAGAPLYSAAKHGVVGLMRALKNDTATLGIACSVVAPGITLTDIIAGRKPGQSLEDWAKEMRQHGVPINNPDEIALAVVWLISQGTEANGKGILVQAGQFADIEAGIAKSRGQWMGEEMLKLFRGGRSAPLFPNKL